MNIKNKKGHFNPRFLIAGTAVCIIISSICFFELPQTAKSEPQETTGQSAETKEINALLKKAEEYVGRAENKYKEADNSRTSAETAWGTQQAIYHVLKAICTQNEVIIKLLREKVDK
ncbi:hypothetical protein HYT26_03295 [Candidatus Pacearchaeota archaeon]|nr:hypothetical protein [Candidatus Pacearchaeota archaeon]